MTIWRIKLNSQRSEEDGGTPDWDEAKEYCRDAGLVGVGWGMGKLESGAPLDTVLSEFIAAGGMWKAGANTVRRLAVQVCDGDLMWTRDSVGRYWLCEISGPWRYDKGTGSVKFDLYNARPAQWLGQSFHDYDVPGAVVRSFTGRGQTLQRLGDHPVAERITERLWTVSTQGPSAAQALTPDEAITDIFDPTDMEDLVLLYLQAQGWILLPSTRMRSTPTYEAALRRKGTGEIAVVSVTTGNSNPVPLDALRAVADGATAYAYSNRDLYNGSNKGITKITTSELIDFIASSPELLPPRISRWLAS